LGCCGKQKGTKILSLKERQADGGHVYCVVSLDDPKDGGYILSFRPLEEFFEVVAVAFDSFDGVKLRKSGRAPLLG